ncbi:MAG: ribonuclease III, partial [Firmicutes bacterium]|nr:ribonuclease III [Bacillota bacterium]
MQKLEALEEIIGYSFKNKELLNRALTHSSFANEEDPGYDNERLEFLGDAVLDMVISNKLFNELRDSREGDLTKLRAAVVCEKSLAKISKDKGINNYLRLGHGEEQSGGRTRNSIVADGMEAIIGAVYVDSGFLAASAMIERLFADAIKDAKEGKVIQDSKTKLQEKLQKNGPCNIEYRLIKEEGPDHAKLFTMAVYVNG